ncbi:MAG: NAD(P)-dependent oxidoreductase [Pseudomonadota bacterium]
MANGGALIVGGAGYFGARLAEALAAESPVTVTYRSVGPSRAAWLERAAVDAVPFDSAAGGALGVEGPFDVVVNLAMPSAGEAKRDPEAACVRALTTIGTVLELLSDGRAKRLVHFSTFHVYGPSHAPNYDETLEPAPIHPYGETHVAVEQAIAEHPAASRAAVVRPTNLVGAPAHAELGDQAGLIFLDLCRQAAAGGMVLQNDGLSYRDMLPFADAIAVVRLLMTASLGSTRTFNLASGNTMRLNALAETIAAVAPEPVTIRYGDGTDALRAPFSVTIDRLKALGFVPSCDLTAEARRCLAFFR